MYKKYQNNLVFRIEAMLECNNPCTRFNEWTRDLKGAVSNDLILENIPVKDRESVMWLRVAHEYEKILIDMLFEARVLKRSLKHYEDADKVKD